MEPGQWKTMHFWMMFLAFAIGTATETHLIPESGIFHKVAIFLSALLAWLGYQSGVKWSNNKPPITIVPGLEKK